MLAGCPIRLPIIQQEIMMSSVNRGDVVTKVEICVCARGLPKVNTFSNIESFAVILKKTQDGYTEIGRTETIDATNNPDFKRRIVVDYSFEEEAVLQIKMFVRAMKSFKKSKLLGTTGEFPLGKLIGAPSMVTSIPLRVAGSDASSGTLTLRAEETLTCPDIVTLHFAGAKLFNSHWICKTNPYLRISRPEKDGSAVMVWKSEVLRNTLNPVWKPASIEVYKEDYDRTLLIELVDWGRRGHRPLGVVETSFRKLVSAAGGGAHTQFPVTMRGCKRAGFLRVLSGSLERRHSLLEYLAGGCKIGMITGVDFTASNGDPRTPGTHHYIDPTGAVPNQYQTVIRSCGTILQEYTEEDKRMPCFGYGASINGYLEHCFPLTLTAGEEAVPTVDAVLEHYSQAVGGVTLSGPTLLAPVLAKAIAYASDQAAKKNPTYTVLVVMADGVINDMSQCTSLLVRASTLPLSVIIVGVGNADFSGMRELDGSIVLDDLGNPACRDFVQFVALRDFQTGGGGEGPRLAQHVLGAIPDQFLSYMRSQNIVPSPRREYRSPPPASPSVVTAPDGTTLVGVPSDILNSAPVLMLFRVLLIMASMYVAGLPVFRIGV